MSGAGDGRNCAGRRSAGRGQGTDISSVEGGGVPGRGSLESRESFCFNLFFWS